MTYWVPLVLIVEGMLVAALISSIRHRRALYASESKQERLRAAFLVHSINDDRCVGCGSCTSACPANVLELVAHHSRVVRFTDCVQCEACARACPTQALVMHKTTEPPPPVTVPNIDENYQTLVPGQYLIGEVAGKPLVKNAANLGRFVVEHMRASGLTPSARRGAGEVDVAIVGSGPAGLSAALTCVYHGLSYVVLEKEHQLASTIARYPKGKHVMAGPEDCQNLSLLPVFSGSKENLVGVWEQIERGVQLNVRRGEAVASIDRDERGLFTVTTSVGRYFAQRVVLATGTRGKPRMLGAPGEQLPKVQSMLDDPGKLAGKHVLVVGGGDSSLEAALSTARAGASVTLAHRGRMFNRAKGPNRQAIEQAVAQGRVSVCMETSVSEVTEGYVDLRGPGGAVQRIMNDAVFVLIGADAPVKWLAKVGVEFVKRPHEYRLGATDTLVQKLIGTSIPCPDTAPEAVAQVLRQRAPTVRRRVRRPFTRAGTVRTPAATAAVSHQGGLRKRSSLPPPLPPAIPVAAIVGGRRTHEYTDEVTVVDFRRR